MTLHLGTFRGKLLQDTSTYGVYRFSQLLAAGDEPKAAASGSSKGASSGGAKQRGGKNKRR